MKRVILSLLFFQIFSTFAGNGRNYWSKYTESIAEKTTTSRQIFPVAYKTYSLDILSMKEFLKDAPLETSANARFNGKHVELPMPNGSSMEFIVMESPIMESGLAAKYPYLKTYIGYAVGNQAFLRMDFTQNGFHAMIRTVEGDVLIDPYDERSDAKYIVYNKFDCHSPQKFSCDFEGYAPNQERKKQLEEIYARANNTPERSIAEDLRTYRLALACTRQYAAVFGGTKENVMAEYVVAINRVNFVYETELGVRMILVDNTDTLIFTTGGPYSNDNGFSMLGQNQTVCDARIKNANYDIGHVFSTGGGGVASLGCVCITGIKAQGVTGLPNPVGDPFYIDYVAHEMGHQFGGNHTFNSTQGSCGGNGETSAAYEPGSGVTIMAYAGICGSDDLAPHSIAYFHTKSLDEIVDFITLGEGDNCPVKTTTGNNAPTIDQMNGNYVIPYNTPFWLEGFGSDPDGQTVTYSWEQFNRGGFSAWNNPGTNSPIFRSYDPSTNGKRYFPKLANVLSNTNTPGEFKPNKARTLIFRLTVRDGIGGVTYSEDTDSIKVIKTSVPFSITSPNTIGIVWETETTQTITWNVAETDTGQINTPNVNIILSLDGGATFIDTLAKNVPNNGSYTFTVPNTPALKARVWVEGAGNIFFDINDKDFKISTPTGIVQNNLDQQIAVFPNPATNQISVKINGSGMFTVKLLNMLGQALLIQEVPAGRNTNIDLSGLASGVYIIEVENESGRGISKFVKE